MPLPPWLTKSTPKLNNIRDLRTTLKDYSFETVCENAKCPNIGECYSNKTLTFMILGNSCTRNCSFCAVDHGLSTVPSTQPIDRTPNPDEPKQISLAVKALNLNYVVITSVTRDDLPDGGSSHFAKTIREIRDMNPNSRIEVLIPDFQGSKQSLDMVIDASPEVINHNIETVPSLYPKIRPQADYQRSLSVLKYVKEVKNYILTKSGIMVGLGETDSEVYQVAADLRNVGCDILTIGQYLRPSRKNAEVKEYVKLETFEKYRAYALSLGFKAVQSAPFVRSSYKADEILPLP